MIWKQTLCCFPYMCGVTLFRVQVKRATSCVLWFVHLCVSVLYFAPCDFVLLESRCKGHQLCCRPKQAKPSQGKQRLRQRRTSQIQIYTQSKSKTENNLALLLWCGQWCILDMGHQNWWNTLHILKFWDIPNIQGKGRNTAVGWWIEQQKVQNSI